MESYYFHVYSVSCDVHFRYSDDAFMWTLPQNKEMKQRDDTNKQTQPAGRPPRRTRKDNHVTFLNL